jgi:uncharacterized protein (TIGR01777 family)
VNAASGKVLVSGSSGLIGAALCSFLAAKGYQVTRLVRGESSGENQISWDPTKPIAPESVSGFDIVVHLAGESIVGRWTDERKAAIRHSRVAGTKNLAKALAEAPQRPRVFISASAIGYYANRGQETLREESSVGRGFLADVCREWEFATNAAADAGIRTAQTRFGIVLSRAGGALAKMLPPLRLGIGGNMGNGRQWWSWIDLQDVVGAIEHVIKTGSLHGAVNVVSPNPVTNAEFTKTLASVLSRPAVFPMPAFVARLALGQMADELLLASQRVEPAKLLASGYSFQQPNLRQSLQTMLSA